MLEAEPLFALSVGLNGVFGSFSHGEAFEPPGFSIEESCLATRRCGCGQHATTGFKGRMLGRKEIFFVSPLVGQGAREKLDSRDLPNQTIQI